MAELRSVIERSDTQCRDGALAILRRADQDELLALYQQPAARTAVTFNIKYTFARERGISVCGLDELVRDLSQMGPALMIGGVVQSHLGSLVVAFDEDMNLVGAICINYAGE